MALYDTFNGEDILIPPPSPEEAKRISLEVTGWLWGTVKGCFNRKMTTSQIIVDAIIGVIPVVGDVTAVRDLIATVIGLVKDPERRKEVMEWVLLVILILALIPLAGGVVKGVGRLVMREAKTVAESRGLLKEIITFLNRMGTGNAVKFIKELEILKYERQVVREFGNLMDRFILVFEKIESKMGRLLPEEMKNLLAFYKKGVKELKELGSKMIPEAVKELDKRLKSLQKMIYEGEWVGIKGEGKSVTREAEARLVEGRAARAAERKMKFPQNVALESKKGDIAKIYKPKPGWPDLQKYPDKVTGAYKDIEAFSGAIEAKVLKGPYEMTRYFDLEKAKPTGAWWHPQGTKFTNAKDWRHDAAVLDSWNKDGFRTICQVPPGAELHGWEGLVSGQFEKASGQFLEGGGKQVYVDLGLSAADREALLRAAKSGASDYKASNGLVFKFEKTGWTDSVGIYGFGASIRDVTVAGVESLGRHERETKVVLGGTRVVHGKLQQ
jgi:hypothetical protein